MLQVKSLRPATCRKKEREHNQSSNRKLIRLFPFLQRSPRRRFELCPCFLYIPKPAHCLSPFLPFHLLYFLISGRFSSEFFLPVTVNKVFVSSYSLGIFFQLLLLCQRKRIWHFVYTLFSAKLILWFTLLFILYWFRACLGLYVIYFSLHFFKFLLGYKLIFTLNASVLEKERLTLFFFFLQVQF